MSVVLWTALIAGFVAVIVHTNHHGARRVSTGNLSGYSHVYPSDPFPFERPPVGTSSPYVDVAGRIHSGASANSVSQLVAISPSGWWRVSGGVYTLTKPLEVGFGSKILINQAAQIDIQTGAFILAQHGAAVSLRGVTLTGVAASGAPETKPVVGRGFVDVRSGAMLLLDHDKISDLGFLGDQTYGITIDGGSGKSHMRNCTVSNDYFGIYIGRVSGVVVSDNHVDRSVIYGIDPHTYDSKLVITHNVVTSSGVHGIVAAYHVEHSLIEANRVVGSKDHGIVLFQFADHNTVRDNVVEDSFDGIVITDSSSNTVSHNQIQAMQRFGIRVSGISSGNLISRNAVDHTLVGIYLYQGASSNRLVSNSFSANYENVRVRYDAPGNEVTPNPGRSEI